MLDNLGTLQLGPFVLSWGRVLPMAGLLVFLFTVEWFARRAGSPRAYLAAWVGVLAGLLVARIVYVATHWNIFSQDLLSIFFVWLGGFSVIPGLAAGALAALFVLRGELKQAWMPLARAAGVSLAVVSVLYGLAIAGSPAPAAQSQTLPSAPVYTMEGKPVTLAEVARGKPVVVNVWATWCPPCRREMPTLDKAAARYEGRVVFVALDANENPQQVKAFLNEVGATHVMPVIDRGEVQRQLGVTAYPTTFFIDSGGRISGRHFGEISAPALEDQLSRLR